MRTLISGGSFPSRRYNFNLYASSMKGSFLQSEFSPSNNRQNKIAVLIDGDNAESSLISEFIAEAGRFGRVTVKRIYADWTMPYMKSWREQLNSFAVRPIQKFAYTKAKSSTDTALIIDAMDLLHSKLVDGFCIVSSDSDYTGLCHRIREEGLFIMGIGKSHTPEAFVKACESFTYSEILTPFSKPYSSSKTAKPAAKYVKKIASNTNSSDSGLSESNIVDADQHGVSPAKIIDKLQIQRAFRIAVNIDTGQAALSRFSGALRAADPSFDPRNFGFPSFRKFCDALQPVYETGTIFN